MEEPLLEANEQESERRLQLLKLPIAPRKESNLTRKEMFALVKTLSHHRLRHTVDI